uniref:Ribosome biogenesis regulatory protein n=1 Tax=Corethrella appendiculata TaxID=1370023 RepID=U5EZJ3_9DIPT
MDIVKEVLEKQQKDLEKYKSINVKKHLEVNIDVGHLMLADSNYFDNEKFKENPEQYLLDLTRDNTQLLVNGIWELETERLEESIVAKLPEPKFILPRAKKLPVPKPLTKWEQIAKAKGIKKRKKDTKVYDAELDKWVPTYGYQRYKSEKEKDWVLEVPHNVDDKTDLFKQKRDLRLERVARNEISRMKNIARAKKIQTPRVGFVSETTATAKQLVTAATIAKSSTASVGVFQEKLPNEKVARGIGVKELIPGKKRKRSVVAMKDEKSRNLEIMDKVLNKKPKLDIDKAVSIQKQEARAEKNSAAESEEGTTKKRKGGKGKRKQGKHSYGKKAGKKPKGGQGKRNPSKRPLGRKRR